MTMCMVGGNFIVAKDLVCNACPHCTTRRDGDGRAVVMVTGTTRGAVQAVLEYLYTGDCAEGLLTPGNEVRHNGKRWLATLPGSRPRRLAVGTHWASARN
jgi:hypothetical protein